MRKECQVGWCHNTNLVYSGTDAFMLGIDTETFCFDCANIYAIIREHILNKKLEVAN